jgi:hypothetical protein
MLTLKPKGALRLEKKNRKRKKIKGHLDGKARDEANVNQFHLRKGERIHQCFISFIKLFFILFFCAFKNGISLVEGS